MADATLIIDTNGIVKKLKQRGFSRRQAEGITEALMEFDTAALATKAELTAPDDLKVAVNVSPQQLKSPALVQVLVNTLAATGLAPQRLVGLDPVDHGQRGSPRGFGAADGAIAERAVAAVRSGQRCQRVALTLPCYLSEKYSFASIPTRSVAAHPKR